MCFDEEGGLANVAWVLNAVTEYLSGDDFLAAKEGCLLQVRVVLQCIATACITC